MRRLGGAKNGIDDIGDIGEVARLLAISVDSRLPTFGERTQHDRDHARVSRTWVLSRTEDIEIANRDRLETVETHEKLHVLLAHELLQRIGRQRIGRHLLALWQRWKVAVRR